MSDRPTIRYAFLDSSVLLHYRFFDEIDWPAELGVERVVLVFTSQVISELDRVKYSTRSTTKADRAQKVGRKLLEIIETGGRVEVRPNVEVLLLDKEPRLDWGAHDLDESWGDDRVIAAVLCSPFPDEEKVLVCADVKFVLKAQTRTIAYHRLRDELALPLEKTPEQREVDRLRKELLRHEARLPVLRLLLKTNAGADVSLAAELKQHARPSSEDIEKRVADKKALLKQQVSQGESRAFPYAGLGQFHEIQARRARERYATDIEQYLAALREYYVQAEEYAEVMSRTVKVELVLSNQGTTPAEDIDIYVHFPDGFQVRHEDEMPRAPVEPAEPVYRPDGWFPRLPDVGSLARGSFSPAVPQRPLIKKRDSYDVDFPTVPTLKHGYELNLASLYAVFSSHDSVKPFHLNYVVHSATLPDAVSGKLHVLARAVG